MFNSPSAGGRRPVKSLAKAGFCRQAVALLCGTLLHHAPAAGESLPVKPPVPESLSLATAGDFVRTAVVEGLTRSWVVHIPAGMNPAVPAPMVLALHGAAMNAGMMAGFSGMNTEADAAKFIVVYPNGTGLADTLLVWNSGGLGPERKQPDDVAFIRLVLDTMARELKLDPKRVYVAGLSNGGMMAYRLAVEMPDRIAAIAAVGGTLIQADAHPARAVPAIHFHGTADRIVPYDGPNAKRPGRMNFLSVPHTIKTWVKLTGCPETPVIQEVPDQFQDGTRVRISTYGPGQEKAEVVLVDVIGGGHTWPGQQPAFSIIGKSTREISANEMIWTFFQKHPLP